MAIAESYTKSVIAFQKAAFESSFNMASMMQEIAGRTIQASLAQVPWIPADGKFMVEHWLGTLQEGRETIRRVVCDSYDQMSENLGRQMSLATMQVTESAREMTRGVVEGGRQMVETARGGFEGLAGTKHESQENRERSEAPKSDQASSKSKGKPIRLNDAEREDLAGLFGIGEATAEKVVGFIEENGPIQDWNELEKIPGIRSSIISRLKEECSL